MEKETVSRMSSEPWCNPRPAPNLDEVRHRMPPKSMISSWLRAWWPALLWAVLIFGASTDVLSTEHTGRFIEPFLRWLFPTFSEDTIILLHEFIRKIAHVCEYAIFVLLLFRGIRRRRSGWHWSWALTAWGLAAAYSLLDEFHQTFVPSRGASIWDSCLDSASAFVTLLIVFFLFRRYQRHKVEDVVPS
jgi:VanZ family protein